MRFTTLITIIVASSLSLIACGGGGGDDDGDDTTGQPDANETTPPDANETAAKQVGDTCVPDGADPMGPGDCGVGFTCLNLQGGNGPWCSKQCDPAADMCAVGYTGLGLPACVYGITFEQGGNPVNFCGVICEDLPGDPAICDAATCSGDCPGTLACSAQLTDENQTHVANACI